MKKLVLVIALGLVTATAAFGQATSVYTNTDEKSCRAVKMADESSYKGICPGVGGYKLELLEGDIRQTINVVAPNKKVFELNLWTTVSSGFSAVGQKIEWRGKKVGKAFRPYALIIRYNVSDAENPEKTISYLAVARISSTGACVVDVVNPVSGQNEKARAVADDAASRPCKE